MIWYSCVASGTPKYTTTCKHWMIGTEAKPPDLQTSNLHPPIWQAKRQPAHFSDLAPCKQTINPMTHHLYFFLQWLKLLDLFHTNDPLLLKKHPWHWRPAMKVWQLQSSNKFVRQSSGQSFHSPASGKGPALVIGLPAHQLRLQNNQQDRFFRESVSPWQLSGVVPIIYLESCILPPPHSVNSDKGFF